MDRAGVRRLRIAAALAATLLLSPGGAAAQIVGLPVHFSPSAENGLRLFGDFALGDSPFEIYGGGRALLNLSYVSLGLMAGKRSDADAAWGANVALNLVRGSLRRYSLSIEGGYGDNEFSQDIPIGIGVALEVDQPAFALEPWAGLRAHIRRSDVPALGRETNVGIGISAGLNASTGVLTKLGIPLPGFGLHLSADYLNIAQPFSEDRDGTLLFNLGLNYLFKMKGPLHGLIPPPACDPTDPTC